jgi:hypothetical protein
MHAWEAHDLTLTRRARLHWSGAPELLGVDLDAILEPPVHVEPDVRVPGIKVWILMQLDRYQRPETYGGVRGGAIVRRRPRPPAPAPLTNAAGHCPF